MYYVPCIINCAIPANLVVFIRVYHGNYIVDDVFRTGCYGTCTLLCRSACQSSTSIYLLHSTVIVVYIYIYIYMHNASPCLPRMTVNITPYIKTGGGGGGGGQGEGRSNRLSNLLISFPPPLLSFFDVLRPTLRNKSLQRNTKITPSSVYGVL